MVNLIGKTVSDAKRELEDLGLKPDISYAYDKQFDKNTVISQSIPADTEVDTNTKVYLTVSKGPDTSSSSNSGVEKSLSMDVSFDDAKNEVFVITIYKIQDGNVEVVHDEVHYKSNGGETITIKGSGKAKLTIYFDKTLIKEMNVDFDTGQIL